jgi:hypothetical protein
MGAYTSLLLNKNAVALAREQTMPTERPPLVGEVVPNFADRGVVRGQRNGFPRSLIKQLEKGSTGITQSFWHWSNCKRCKELKFQHGSVAEYQLGSDVERGQDCFEKHYFKDLQTLPFML